MSGHLAQAVPSRKGRLQVGWHKRFNAERGAKDRERSALTDPEHGPRGAHEPMERGAMGA